MRSAAKKKAGDFAVTRPVRGIRGCTSLRAWWTAFGSKRHTRAMLRCKTHVPDTLHWLQIADFCEEIVMSLSLAAMIDRLRLVHFRSPQAARLEKEKFAERESPPSRTPVTDRRRSAAHAAITRRAARAVCASRRPVHEWEPGSQRAVSRTVFEGPQHAGNTMIEISHLSKRYGALTAVDDITFNVQRRRGARLPRPERRRQVDHDEDDHRLPRADRRQRARLRPRRRDRTARGQGAAWATCPRARRATAK